MPADGVMRHGARGFGQNHGERDEHEWLPQLGNLIPDEKSKEGCACGREETAESALPAIVAMRREFCGEIKHGAEDRQSQQTRAHVRVRWTFQVQVDRNGAEKREEAEQCVLRLQIARLQRAADARQCEHQRGKRNRRPILREQSPGRGGGRKCAEIGMDVEHRPIERALEQCFPARAGA